MTRSRPAPFLVAATALTALLLLGACSTNRPMKEQMSDAAITTKVKSKLTADPQVNPIRIDVDTIDGVVSLRGRVPEEAMSAEAEKLARSTSGVRDVRNRLTVGPAPDDQAAGSDASIHASVKSKLVTSRDLSAMNVDVDVQDGVVTLSGTMRNETARTRAAELASEVRGVKRVVNELEVRPGA